MGETKRRQKQLRKERYHIDLIQQKGKKKNKEEKRITLQHTGMRIKSIKKNFQYRESSEELNIAGKKKFLGIKRIAV